MTRTGLSSRLSQHRREPLVEVHPADIADLGLIEGALAVVTTAQGESVFRVEASEGQRRGELFTPIHWTDRQSNGGRTGLLPRAVVDPHSGQPAFKQTPARIEALPVDWHGFAVLRNLPRQIAAAYATQVRVAHGWLVELAGVRDPGPLIETMLPPGERLESVDIARGVTRIVVMGSDRLEAAIYLTRAGPLPAREWIIARLGMSAANGIELLAGRPANPAPDQGPIVCVCFDIGARTIAAAARGGAKTVDAIGQVTCAGTNCGSCRPAIAGLLEAARISEAEAVK
jgi:assimilatory nitrate reductase catalytic subunit